MRGLVYIDESGDHAMDNIDPGSPVFCLALTLYKEEAYAKQIVPALTQLKLKYCGHDGVVLRSYDIRKRQGDFAKVKPYADFLDDVSNLMASEHYELIAVAVHKDKHVARYANPVDPYDFAIELALERLVQWAEVNGITEVIIIAESRGPREDKRLEAEFWRVVGSGTSFIGRSRFKAVDFQFRCATKALNLPGHQMADLAAYAVARQERDRTRIYPSYAVIAPRFFRKNGIRLGLKVFP